MTLLYRGRQYVALTPQQKERKNEWQLQQRLQQNQIPTFEEAVAYLESAEARKEDQSMVRSFGMDRAGLHGHCEGDGAAARMNPRLLDPDIPSDEYDAIIAECVQKELRYNYDKAVRFVEQYVDDGKNCWRAVRIPEHMTPESFQRLGVYWTTEKYYAVPYYRKSHDGTDIVYQGVIDTKYVDLLRTVVANFVFETTEYEVRWLPNAPIFVEGYFVEKDPEMEILEEYRRC